MANNPYVNKVEYGNQTVMDISDTTAEESDVAEGEVFYKGNGQRSVGTGNYYSPNDTAETDIADGDYFPFYDISAQGKRKTLWSNILAKIKTALVDRKCDNSVVAPVENGTTASKAYKIGEHFIRDGAFCTAKTAIAMGAAFTLNTNYTAENVGSSIISASNAWKSILHAYDTYNPDNLITLGVYHVKVLAANSPTGSDSYGILFVLSPAGSAVAQIYITSGDELWYRYKNSTAQAWHSWKKVTAI
jgi:hypothetical protein